jgi:hypothetical protein
MNPNLYTCMSIWNFSFSNVSICFSFSDSIIHYTNILVIENITNDIFKLFIMNISMFFGIHYSFYPTYPLSWTATLQHIYIRCSLDFYVSYASYKYFYGKETCMGENNEVYTYALQNAVILFNSSWINSSSRSKRYRACIVACLTPFWYMNVCL